MFNVSFTKHLKYNLNEADSFKDLFSMKEQVYQSVDNTLANAHARATITSWAETTGILSVTNIFGEFINLSVDVGTGIYRAKEIDTGIYDNSIDICLEIL